jgi:hypothetical protein
MNAKPEWLESLSVLHLQPGDVLVLRSNDRLPREAVTEVSNRMRQVFPNHKTVILDQLDLGVVRQGEIGLTWDMVDAIRWAGNYGGNITEGILPQRLDLLLAAADRIAALLPPREG